MWGKRSTTGSSSYSTLRTRSSGGSRRRGSFSPSSSIVVTFGMSTYAMNIKFFKGLLFPSTNGTISLTLYFSEL